MASESDIYRFPEGFVPEDIAALFKPGLKTVNEMQNIVEKMTAIVDEAGRDISEEELALQKDGCRRAGKSPGGYASGSGLILRE